MSVELLEALEFFIIVFGELALLFVLISILVGYINQKLPPERIKQMLSGNRGYAIAIVLGAITPFCSCSTLPMTIGLLRARAQFGPVMAFLFTSPLLNPFIVALFWISFGAQITLIYAGFVLGLAVLSGLLLQHFNFNRFIRTDLMTKETCGQSEQSGCKKSPVSSRNYHLSLKMLAQDSLKQFKSFAPYLILGVAVGAIVHGYVPEALFAKLGAQEAWWLIPLAALIGVFLYIRASAMVPIAASLAAKGLSMGAIMSLTIGGAGASLPEMIMMKKMFHCPLLLAFIGLVFSTACLTGFVVEML